MPFQSRFGSFKEEKNFWSFLKVKPKIYQFSYKSSFIFELKFTFCLRASETCQCKCESREWAFTQLRIFLKFQRDTWVVFIFISSNVPHLPIDPWNKNSIFHCCLWSLFYPCTASIIKRSILWFIRLMRENVLELFDQSFYQMYRNKYLLKLSFAIIYDLRFLDQIQISKAEKWARLHFLRIQDTRFSIKEIVDLSDSN